MDGEMGNHGGASAIPLGLSGDLLSSQAETGRGRNLSDSCELRNSFRSTGDGIVKRFPGCYTG